MPVVVLETEAVILPFFPFYKFGANSDKELRIHMPSRYSDAFSALEHPDSHLLHGGSSLPNTSSIEAKVI